MTTAEGPERADFWRTTLRPWTLAFAVGIVLTGVAVALVSTTPTSLARGLAIVGLLGAAYAFLGYPAARRGHAGLAHAYLTAVCVLTPLATANAPVSAILLFISYSHIWFFATSRRLAVVLTLVLTIGVFGGFAWLEDFSESGTRDAVIQGLIAAAFATLLGLWVTYIAEQSEERAELLAQLGAAQDELARTSHDAGVMAERERLAREIHDTLAQGFTSIVMLAQTAEAELVDGASAGATERVRLIETTARDNLAEARALVAAFAPAGLTDATLREALDRLASRFTAETGIAVEVEHPAQELVLGRAHEVVVLRVAQESLTNVRRHAAASSARVRLSVGADGGAQLEIADDGRGIDPAHAEGFGLRGMRDRVDATGGRIEVGSPVSGGTVVRVQLPAPSSTEESP